MLDLCFNSLLDAFTVRSWTWALPALQVQDRSLKLKLSCSSARPRWCVCRTGSRRSLPNSSHRARACGAGAMRRTRLTTPSKLLFTSPFWIDLSPVDGQQPTRQHRWKRATSWQRSWTETLRPERQIGQHNAETWCRANSSDCFTEFRAWFPAAASRKAWLEPCEVGVRCQLNHSECHKLYK